MCTQPAQAVIGLDVVAARAKEEAQGTTQSGPERVPALLALDYHHSFHKFKVAEFRQDGSVSVLERATKELGLAARDSAMFSTTRAAAHRATIGVREGKILLRTEVIRAILHRDRLILFECRRPALSERVGLAVLHAITAARKRAPNSIPFELRMLEVLLDHTVLFLEDKAHQIRMLSQVVQHEIDRKVNSADIRRLLPLQKAVTALEYDIRETSEAIHEVADNEKRLSMLCLSEDQNLATMVTERWTPHMHLAHRLLLAYDSRIRSLDSELRELTEHLDSTREVWHMQLDAMRNRIIRLNLHLEFASVACMCCVAPAAFFGMNLTSGLEEAPGMFWPVAAGSVASGVVIYAALVLYYNMWPLQATKRRMADMTALKDLLLYHVDEVGDVLQALQRSRAQRRDKISKQEFTTLVNQALASQHATHGFSQDMLDLLYRVLDTNKDGRIDVTELARAHTGAMQLSQDSEGLLEVQQHAR